MPLQNQCVVCDRPLSVPHRADARYCGSNCRVRAFRARGSCRGSKDLQTTWRLPAPEAGTPGAKVRTQLAIFRELRQAHRRSVDSASQLARAQKQTEQQNARYEEQLRDQQAAVESVNARAASVEEKLAAAQALIEAQTEALAQEAEQSERERRRFTEQEQKAQRDAEAQAQTVERLRASTDEKRATWQRNLLEAQQQTSVVKQQFQKCTAEREQAVSLAIAMGENLLTVKRKIAELEAELVKKNAFIAEAGPKLKSLYARLLLIKEKRDWRL